MITRSLLSRMVMATIVAGLASNVLAGPVKNKQLEGKSGSAADVLCPVMGDAVNFLMSTPTPDGPVYVCCPGCIDKIKAKPAKYASQVADQRKALAKLSKIQVTCPVTGEGTDKKQFVEHNGEKVYFCCGNCVKKFKASPDRYQEALANSYTYQTMCPVMGEKINPSVFMETRAGKVYFCCKMCDEKLVSKPDKYLPKLKAQGVVLSAADLAGDSPGDHDAHKGHGDHGDHGGHDDHKGHGDHGDHGDHG